MHKTALKSAFILLIASPAFADPPFKVFQAVEIQVGTESAAGFATYLSEDLFFLRMKAQGDSENPKVSDAPATDAEIEKMLRDQGQIPFYPGLAKIKFPREMLVITKARRDIESSKAQKIQLKSNPLNGSQIYGAPNLIDEAAAKDLLEKPFFMCQVEPIGCCKNTFWISYNPNVGEEKLKSLCIRSASPNPQMERKVADTLKIKRVYRLEEATD